MPTWTICSIQRHPIRTQPLAARLLISKEFWELIFVLVPRYIFSRPSFVSILVDRLIACQSDDRRGHLFDNRRRQTTLTVRVPRADGLPLSNPLAGGGAAPGCRGRRDGLPAGDGSRASVALGQIGRSAGHCVVWYITETIICVPEPLSPLQ